MTEGRTPLRRPKNKAYLNLTLNDSVIQHDDEEERRQRRSMVQMRRSVAASKQDQPVMALSFVNQSVTANDRMDVDTNKTGTEPPKAVLMNDKELKIHFDLCWKMLHENKITVKNAWSLHIIDYIQEIIEKKYHGNNMFQTAASTLEICAKVYECRVDDLHAVGIRLSRALAAAENSNGEVLSDYEGDAELPTGTKTKAKKKRRKFVVGTKNTICKDPKSLCGPIPQVSKHQFTIHTDGDPEQTANLFSFVVPIDHNYMEHLNDSINPGFLTYGIEDLVDTKIIGKYKPKFRKHFRICKNLKDFRVNKPHPTLEDTINESLGIAAQVFDDDGQPIVELDGSFCDPFVDDHVVDEEEVQQGFCNVRRVAITSFGPNLQSVTKDGTMPLTSSTLDEDMPKWMKTIWIGPSHWKNKLVRPSVPRFSGKMDQKPVTKRKTKKAIIDAPIDFKHPEKYREVNMVGRVRARKPPKVKKSVLLPKNYLKDVDMDKFCLFDYAPDSILKAVPKDGSDEAFEHSPYDYNNLNDSQYCPENNADDDDLGNQNPAEIDPETGCSIAEGAAAGNPVDAGVMADISHPGENSLFNGSYVISPAKPVYSAKAKNVNIRKIREAMWEIIARGAEVDKQTEQIRVQATKFTRVFSTILTELPTYLTRDLSIQIGFFVLLQIAQEGNIMLQSTENNGDTLILTGEEEIFARPLM